MATRAAFLLSLFLLASGVTLAKQPEANPSMRVWLSWDIAKEGWGHLCAVNPRLAYTATHVSMEEDSEVFMTWSDLSGNGGSVRHLWRDKRRDLSMVTWVHGSEFTTVGVLSPIVPKKDDEVTFRGYKVDKGLEQSVIKAKVLTVWGGRITYKQGRHHGGASGSCVLNSEGQIVAVHTGTVGALQIGVGSVLAGDWHQVPEQFKARATIVEDSQAKSDNRGSLK